MVKEKQKKNVTEKKRYPRWFYLVLIALPILFFVLLEIGLRLFGYGIDYPVFVELSEQYPGKLFFNPDLPKKYFSNIKNTPAVIPDGFDAEKKENTIRVFVLGESSAAGWPYIPNASFPRYIKRRLELLYPEKNVEVINLGVSAICSYTLRDILPDALKQKPDVILIYTGHNEYYGALGAASTQSLGKSRGLINFVLSIQKYRVVQFVQSVIKSVWSAGSEDNSTRAGQNETLMAQVIGENHIPFNSDLYNAGLDQFRGNMRDILQMCKDEHVPVVIGSLSANLRDLHPFISDGTAAETRADSIFEQAQRALAMNDTMNAKKLFYRAMDLDGLRFRAPSAVNMIITELAGQFQIPLVNIDSIMNAESKFGITGNDLMVDHLHPNIRGYQIIGQAFCSALVRNGILQSDRINLPDVKIDSALNAQFPFTSLDSVIADIRVRILTGSYPFVPKGQENLLIKNFKPALFRDTLAMRVIDKDITIEDAHYQLADIYYAEKNIDAFEKELLVVIADRPFNPYHYHKLIDGLVGANEAPRALPYLYTLDKLNSDYYTTKWIGGILLAQGDYQNALAYLEKSVIYNSSDPQAWYNLAGAYFYTSNMKKAMESAQNALKINPRYMEARAFYEQLKAFMGK